MRLVCIFDFIPATSVLQLERLGLECYQDPKRVCKHSLGLKYWARLKANSNCLPGPSPALHY